MHPCSDEMGSLLFIGGEFLTPKVVCNQEYNPLVAVGQVFGETPCY